MKLINKIKQFDAHIASTSIYRAIDRICNILLVLAVFALVIMAVVQQASILSALSK
jgi:hypothetical protein